MSEHHRGGRAGRLLDAAAARLSIHLGYDEGIGAAAGARPSSLRGMVEQGHFVVPSAEGGRLVEIGIVRPFVIGGMMIEDRHDRRRGLPGLSKIPLLGRLFRHREKTDSEREVLIVLTPTPSPPTATPPPRRAPPPTEPTGL